MTYSIILQDDGSCYSSTKKEITINFPALKQKAIDILDNRGWDDKEDVDLRSLISCVEYVYLGDNNHIESIRRV